MPNSIVRFYWVWFIFLLWDLDSIWKFTCRCRFSTCVCVCLFAFRFVFIENDCWLLHDCIICVLFLFNAHCSIEWYRIQWNMCSCAAVAMVFLFFFLSICLVFTCVQKKEQKNMISLKNTTEKEKSMKGEEKNEKRYIVREQIRSILFGRLHHCRWYGFVFLCSSSSFNRTTLIHSVSTMRYFTQHTRSWIWAQIVFQFNSMFHSIHRSLIVHFSVRFVPFRLFVAGCCSHNAAIAEIPVKINRYDWK